MSPEMQDTGSSVPGVKRVVLIRAEGVQHRSQLDYE